MIEVGTIQIMMFGVNENRLLTDTQTSFCPAQSDGRADFQHSGDGYHRKSRTECKTTMNAAMMLTVAAGPS